MPRRPFRRLLGIALHMTLLLGLFGCYGMADYQYAEELKKGNAAAIRPTDPDYFAVDSRSFPRYRAARKIVPPPWFKDLTIEILPTDIWHVTHGIGDRSLIQSEAFQDRVCRYLFSLPPAGTWGGRLIRAENRCEADYLYGIWIDSNGRVTGGWVLLHNPRMVLFSYDRRIVLRPDNPQLQGWDPQPVFERMD